MSHITHTRFTVSIGDDIDGAYDNAYLIVRTATDAERNPRGTDTQYAVFWDGGVLCNGDDCALFETWPEAIAFAMTELDAATA